MFFLKMSFKSNTQDSHFNDKNAKNKIMGGVTVKLLTLFFPQSSNVSGNLAIFTTLGLKS